MLFEQKRTVKIIYDVRYFSEIIKYNNGNVKVKAEFLIKLLLPFKTVINKQTQITFEKIN